MTIMVAAIDAEEAAEGRAGIVHMHTDAGANPTRNWPADGSNGTQRRRLRGGRQRWHH